MTMPTDPQWWLKRLHKQLGERQPLIEKYDRYYRGDHPLPWLPEQAQEEFRRVLKMARANVLGLVVDAQVERMVVEGFRIGNSEEADADASRIWQANNLDADSDLAFLESAKSGMAYMLTGPNPADQTTPIISVEHPSQAIVEYQPGNRRVRVAGLKEWCDDWTGAIFADVQILGSPVVFQYLSKSKGSDNPTWVERGDPIPNPLKEVTLVELPNNPRLGCGGVSELADLTDIQDRINKTLVDRLMTQDFGAFPQKWATGWPQETPEGDPTEPINVGRDRMVTTDVKSNEAAFGQWDAAPLDPYSSAKREDVKDIASRSRTPAQYLLGELTNVNGETLKASESGLVSKVRQRQRPQGEGLEEVMRLARRLAGTSTAQDYAMETIWRSPEYRTEGETVDALVKMSTLGVPLEALWERWGASQEEIRRWKTMQAEQAQRQGAADIASFLAGPKEPPAAA